MKRPILAWTIVLALGVVPLGGCGLGRTTASAPGPSGANHQAATTVAVGTNPLLPPPPGIFQPQSAASFGGIASIGYLLADPFSGKFVPAVATLVGGNNVRFEKIGTAEKFVTSGAQVGSTRVVVGHSLPAGATGHDQVPFVATSDSGAAFVTRDLGQLVGGRSAELHGVAATGASSSDAALMAVGGVGRTTGDDVGSVTGTDPFAIVSQDGGKSWTMAAALPLPSGVTAAEALCVTRAPDGTAFPGVIVVGGGWTETSGSSAREVGIVWQSQDEGKTWSVVSDSNFSQAGHDFWPEFVAADDSTVIVAGWTDAVGSVSAGSPPTRSQDYEWVVGKDGKWSVVSDGSLLPAARSSVTTALISRAGGGFLWAGETYDTTAGASFQPGGQPKGNPSVWLYETADGATWKRFDSVVPGVGSAAVVVGIAESGNRTAFFGVEANSVEDAWVVDKASVK